MNFRLKTTNITAEKLKQLQASTNFTPNVLARIAVSLSLKQPGIPEFPNPESKGLEFNRNTITGEHDYLFHTLIAQHANTQITDEQYFPSYFNAHLERGIYLLSNEYRHAGNPDKFITNLLNYS